MASYYYSEILELIDKFREKIKESNLKEKIESLEKECKFKKEKIIIEKENKENYEYNVKNLSLNDALSAIDHYTYIINCFGTINENATQKEKAMGAYMITKIIDLELNYFKNNFKKYK